MPLNIEPVIDELILFLRQRLPAQLVDTVSRAADTRVPVTLPAASSYYIGEWSRFRSYILPACFVVTNRSTATGRGQNVETWMHAVLLDFLIEGAEEESLTRACWRIADAAYGALHDQDVTAVSGVTTRGAIVQVMAIDYGPMIARAPEGRPFRKDVFLSLDINHKDLLTPIG